MIKQPVKIALSMFHDFQTRPEILKARKQASKRGNRLLRHKYKQLLKTTVDDKFEQLIISVVFG